MATITTVATNPPEARLGPIRQTYAGADSFPHLTRAYTQISQVIRETGLLSRASWFYALVGTAPAARARRLHRRLHPARRQLVPAAHRRSARHRAHPDRVPHPRGRAPPDPHLGPRERPARAHPRATASSESSNAWWNTKHTRHHAQPEPRRQRPRHRDRHDLASLEEDAAKTPWIMTFITRRQGWLFFPLLTLEGFNLHYLERQAPASTAPNVKGRWIELSLIALRFTVYLGALFWMLPLGMAFAFLGVQLAVFGVYMGATLRPEPQGHADHRPRREARLLHQAGAHLAQRPRRLVGHDRSWAASTTRSSTTSSRACRDRTSRRPASSSRTTAAPLDVPYTETTDPAVLRHRHRVPEPRRPVRPRPVRLQHGRSVPQGLTPADEGRARFGRGLHRFRRSRAATPPWGRQRRG